MTFMKLTEYTHTETVSWKDASSLSSRLFKVLFPTRVIQLGTPGCNTVFVVSPASRVGVGEPP